MNATKVELNGKKIIVVLGMHRSGTSAITRGLQALGIELGNRLLPPIEGINDKGFFEDIEFNAFNIEILEVIKSDWHYLSPIEAIDIETLRRKGYFLRAIELIREKVADTPTFGFKDPRVAKLLPFWKEVFAHCGFDVRYVIAIRNPLSVVKSLAKRDSFDFEKSYLLWLGHVLSSLSVVEESKHVLVDYDRLMNAPEEELKRIAQYLDLPIKQGELQRYKSEFLDKGLRSTVYHLSDLLLDYTCPPLVREIYSTLLDVASDNRQIEDVPLILWTEEFGRIKSNLHLADKLFGDISNLNQVVTERNEDITKLDQEIVAKDEEISSLTHAIKEKDEQLTSLTHAIKEKDERITILTYTIAEREELISNFSQSEAEKYKAHIHQLENAVFHNELSVQELKLELARKGSELDSIFKSRSWRITAPCRAIAGLGKRVKNNMRQKVAKNARAVYHVLPVSFSKKQYLKGVFFQLFAFALSETAAYQRWKAYNEIKSGNRKYTQKQSIEANLGSLGVSQVPNLPEADGIWEWNDYSHVKGRIGEIKSFRRESYMSISLPTIDIKNEDYVKVANKVNLPIPSESPKVSIIVPVFNQIKLTLECLLSICAHTGSDITYEVIIADDASTDETPIIINKIKNLRVKRNEKNMGFLRNCNGALQDVRGEYVIFLNNDVQVMEGWLEALLSTFEKYENVGAVGPKVLYPSGHLQEAGATLRTDGTSLMIGLNEDPNQSRFSYPRRVNYCSGACLMLPAKLLRSLDGFSDEFAPSYCEDADICMKVIEKGYYVYINPLSKVIHHLSKTMNEVHDDFKFTCITKNLVTLTNKWYNQINDLNAVRYIAFYLPQFHPIPENDHWWGKGFTEWRNVSKARPNFVGHYQPRLPAELGYYDLRVDSILEQQAELAKRYGVYGFCFYYYWFGGKRLLEEPIEKMLESGKPDMPFCLCWANENWTRRWDGKENEILISQTHSESDDEDVILDLIRYFRDPRYIRIDNRPLILIYRVSLFPDFAVTALRWREICRREGIGEIYISMVESFELIHAEFNPRQFGCDAAVEFPPQGLADAKQPSGEVINPEFQGLVADYRDLAVFYATRELPAYKRFRGVMPGWDNTPRRQNNSFCFENSTPGAFQAWVEEVTEQTRCQFFGDESIVFINAWNEWAEGAYLEPDQRFGHAYLEALRNASDAERLLRLGGSGIGI